MSRVVRGGVVSSELSPGENVKVMPFMKQRHLICPAVTESMNTNSRR